MKNPCLSCDHHLAGGDKGVARCANCRSRLRYVAAIGPMSASMPDAMMDIRRLRSPAGAKTESQGEIMPSSKPPPPAAAAVSAPIPKRGRPANKSEAKAGYKVCTNKDCARGGQQQPIDDFYSNPMASDGRQAWCKTCVKAAATRRRKAAAKPKTAKAVNGPNSRQPKPVKNKMPAVWDLVLADIEERDRIGSKKYGTRLQPFNGRDALVDAYQEALDLVVYLRQLIYERDGRTAIQAP